jgi:hypothetical protein
MTAIDPLATADPLGIGGLLVDTRRCRRLGMAELAHAVRSAAELGLRHHTARPPAHARLAFRELGLSIGLAADGSRPDLRAELESHWLDPTHRRTPLYQEHADINDVMLATSLIPDGFLGD